LATTSPVPSGRASTGHTPHSVASSLAPLPAGRPYRAATVPQRRDRTDSNEGSLSRVVRLIHLNGPPGIGKSTIARAFADRHPGVLNLDIDQVAAMIGGWGDSFVDSFEAGRLLAAAMARVHLASGHDVIMPQMMTLVNATELADFEAAAAAAKAEYLQILLTASVEPSVERCMERAKAGDPQDVVSKVIGERGGRDFVRMLHAQVTQFSADRQPHSVIDCERLTVEQTCQAVEAALRST
jgi:predicted ABC-type ATPase